MSEIRFQATQLAYFSLIGMITPVRPGQIKEPGEIKVSNWKRDKVRGEDLSSPTKTIPGVCHLPVCWHFLWQVKIGCFFEIIFE